MSHTLRLLLLPKPLTHLALPGSLRGHLSWDSGLGQERETAPPRVFPLSLHGSAQVPWSRDSMTQGGEWNLSPRSPPGERTRITNHAHCCTDKNLKTTMATFILLSSFLSFLYFLGGLFGCATQHTGS